MDSSLQPLAKLELYQYFYILVSNHFMKLFYNVSQLEMLIVGQVGFEPINSGELNPIILFLFHMRKERDSNPRTDFSI